MTPDYGDRTVFMSYFVEGKEYYLYIPYRGYSGLLTVASNCCVITDLNKKDFVRIVSDDGQEYYVHFALEDKVLLERVIDHDRHATDAFVRVIEDLGESI